MTKRGGAHAGRSAFIVSCEHAGKEVPRAYCEGFASAAARAALDSHRGWDRGSEVIAEYLARELEAPLMVQRVSRLVVDCNRSLDHPALFSEFSRELSEAERAVVLERYWRRHRDGVGGLVDAAPSGATVVHVGVHTFTSVWKGRRRSTDVGLLYDPRRRRESETARRWRRALVRSVDGEGVVAGAGVGDELRVHLNRPYRGWTDGLTTTLRGELSESRYMGFELEVCHRLVPLPGERIARIADALKRAVEPGESHG